MDWSHARNADHRGAHIRRVLQGETVPAADKVVSLFEPDTYIVRKCGRNTYYDQRANRGTGAAVWCSMPWDKNGNQRDRMSCLTTPDRHWEHYGAAPSHAAFNGG